LESQITNPLQSSVNRIAAHYDAAGMVEKAIHFYQVAAKHAPQIYANYEAITYLQRAITLLKTLPESSERDQHELALLNALIPSFVAVTNYAVAQLREIYERVYVLSQKLAAPFPPVLLRILAIHKISERAFQQAEELGQQLITLSQQATEDAQLIQLQGCYVLGVATFWQGHFAQAGTYFQQVVDAYSLVQQEHHITTYGHDTGIYCRARLGWTLWYLGYPEQARQQCAQAAELAGKLQHPVTLYLGLAHCVWCACNLRDVRVVESLLHTLYAQSAATAAQEMEVFRFFDGWRLLLSGNTAEALTYLINFAALARTFGTDTLHYPHTIALLAEAYRCNGGYAQGLVTLTEALDLLAHNQNYWYIAEMYRLQGELLIGQGAQMAEAEACFQQALVIARRQQAKSLELRAAMSLARLWDQQGKRSQAETVLTEVYHWFTEGFDTPDLQEAKTLLEQLQCSVP
jgi:adenylate cyclase